MIDFACKKFDLNEVIRCGLGLTKAEFKIFRFFLKHSKFVCTSEISKNLDLDLSTVQRAVKKLYSYQILSRQQKNLENGGYIFEYSLRDKKEIKEKVLQVITSWTERVKSEFNSW